MSNHQNALFKVSIVIRTLLWNIRLVLTYKNRVTCQGLLYRSLTCVFARETGDMKGLEGLAIELNFAVSQQAS